MPTYKLTYFHFKARAEPIRYLFHLSGVEFEDNRIDGETFQKLKPSLPLGQLPVLEVDGKQLPQSFAIMRYVARRVGLYGANDWERAQADVVLDTLQEMTPQRLRIFEEKDEAKKAELRKTFEAEDLKKNLEKLEKLLIQNEGGDGWFVGHKPGIADAMCYSAYVDFQPFILGKEPDLSNSPKFAALLKRFEGLPQIAEYIKTRPVSAM